MFSNTPASPALRAALAAVFAVCAPGTMAQDGAPQKPASPALSVQFPAEHRYTDAGDNATEVALTEQRLTQMFDRLTKRHLAAGARLSVEFRDIDLAGEPRPGAVPPAQRLLRGRTDVPRLAFAWRLEPAQGEVRSGAAQLSDLGYLQGWRPAVEAGPLPHEERLLARWFRDSFGR